MSSYLVETYLPRTRAGELHELMSRARLSVDAMRAEGLSVRYVRTTFLPADETCFHLFTGTSKATIEEAARRAEFTTSRIVEAIEPRRTGRSSVLARGPDFSLDGAEPGGEE
jgi:hypothetical protein